MRNSNANNTILFSEKKKEFENSKDNHNFHDHKALKDKNAEIISLSSYKRLKFKKNHFKKEGHVDTNKNKLKKMLTWYVGMKTNFSVSVGKYGKLLDESKSATDVL